MRVCLNSNASAVMLMQNRQRVLVFGNMGRRNVICETIHLAESLRDNESHCKPKAGISAAALTPSPLMNLVSLAIFVCSARFIGGMSEGEASKINMRLEVMEDETNDA